MRSVLISGAGIAGATLAHWLLRRGMRPTVVEQSQGVRSSGNPVDVRGAAVPITEEMGVLPILRDHATRAEGTMIVDDAGRSIAALPGGPTGGGAQSDEIEVLRTDLARVLLDSARDAEIILHRR